MSEVRQLVEFDTLEAAKAADAKAFAFLVAKDGAKGNAWSNILTNGTKYGILCEQGIEKAFTDQELGKTGSGDSATYTKVISGETATKDADGKVTKAGWDTYQETKIAVPDSGAVKVSDGKK